MADLTISYELTQTLTEVGSDPRHGYNAVTGLLESLWQSHKNTVKVKIGGREVVFDPLGNDMGHHQGHDLPWWYADGTIPEGAPAHETEMVS